MKRFHHITRLALVLGALLVIFGCSSPQQPATLANQAARPFNTAVAITPVPTVAPTQAAPIFGYTVVATYPHDRRAFTQGLVYIGDNTFFEGTGDYANSSLRRVDLATGEVRQIVMLADVAPPADPPHFGEGIAVVGDQIFQLTWRSGLGMIYDRTSFRPVGQFSYPPPGASLPLEGWGLTYDGSRLIMSDGTANLYFVDPAATASSGVLAITGQVTVRDRGELIGRLNELEYINGAVFANIWGTDQIARIDPATGQVTGWLDLTGILPPEDRAGVDVLNGIAYDPAADRLFITGKWWPKLFEIDIVAPFAQYIPLLDAG